MTGLVWNIRSLPWQSCPKDRAVLKAKYSGSVKLAWEDLEQLQMLRKKSWQEDESERQTVAAVTCTARGP